MSADQRYREQIRGEVAALDTQIREIDVKLLALQSDRDRLVADRDELAEIALRHDA